MGAESQCCLKEAIKAGQVNPSKLQGLSRGQALPSLWSVQGK